MKDEIKKLKYLIFLKNEQIKQDKKELKALILQLKELEGIKTLERKRK